MNEEELKYWKEEFPELTEEEIIEICEIIADYPDEEP